MKTKEELEDKDIEKVSGGADGLEKNMWVGGGPGVHNASSVTEQEAQAVEKMTDKIREKNNEWLNN